MLQNSSNSSLKVTDNESVQISKEGLKAVTIEGDGVLDGENAVEFSGDNEALSTLGLAGA